LRHGEEPFLVFQPYDHAASSPTVNPAFPQSGENPQLKAFVLVFLLPQKLFYFLPISLFVDGAKGLNDFKTVPFAAGDNRAFRRENQRAYKRQVLYGQIAFRGKTAYSPFLEQVHHKGFDRVVITVREGDFIATRGFRHVVQRASAHFGAQRTRIGFFPYVENYFGYIGSGKRKRDAQPVAKAFYA
jgi:hypothetical protein